MKGIKDRSIIVTGGSTGIGEAAVRLLASNGAYITIADTNSIGGEALSKELTEQGLKVQFVKTDITSETDVIAMVDAAIQRYGRLDGAFNNAAIPNVGRPLHELPLADWNRCQGVNVTGTYLCMKHEIAAFLKAGGGSIVNTASVGGFIHIPAATEYVTSKHAVVGLTKSAAADYGSKKIRINAIAPATTRTPMYLRYLEINPAYEASVAATHPLGRAAEPIEQAEAAMWLLSDAASFVTGATLLVDGGYTLL